MVELVENRCLGLLCSADNDHYAIVMARDCWSALQSSRVKPPHPFYIYVRVRPPRSTYRCINFSEDTTNRHNNLPRYPRSMSSVRTLGTLHVSVTFRRRSSFCQFPAFLRQIHTETHSFNCFRNSQKRPE